MEFLPEGHVWSSFASILQGDHAGVEIATEAHTSLLQKSGLLQPHFRMVASRPLRSRDRAEGLVIDDFFSVSFEPKESTADGSSVESYKHYKPASATYQATGLLGSPHKDLVGVEEGRVIGAYINGRTRATSEGMVSVDMC